MSYLRPAQRNIASAGWIVAILRWKTLTVILLAGLLSACAAQRSVDTVADIVVEREEVSFIVIGDWGNYGNRHQRAVAARMNELAARRPVDFIVSTGDNIYDKGVQNVDDPLFKQAFEDIYSLQHLSHIDWYLVLGNHDYRGNYQAQVDYSETNPRWHLPETYHSLVVQFDGVHRAVLLLTDTNAFSRHYRNNPDEYVGVDAQDWEAQLDWVDESLAQHGNADWRVVVGHHPVYSGSRRGGRVNQDMLPLLRLMERHDVRAYFAGHDHDLQHLKPPGAIEHFVSGAGSKLRPVGKSAHTRFAVSQRGFAYVTLNAAEMIVEFVNVEGDVIYRTTTPIGGHAAEPPANQSVDYAGGNVTFEDGRLVLQNDRIARTYAWNHGNPISLSLRDKLTDQSWSLLGEQPDVVLDESLTHPQDARLTIREVASTSIVREHIAVEIVAHFDQLEVKRVCKVFAATPAIGCDLFLRGQATKDWGPGEQGVDALRMVETAGLSDSDDAPVVERLQLKDRHWSMQNVQFSAATDHNDTLVQTGTAVPYRKDQRLAGNLLLLTNTLNRRQLFVLREAPATIDQLYNPGYDFTVSHGNVRVNGVGVSAGDLEPEVWTRGYGTVVGVAGEGELALLDALRRHQETSRTLEAGRDHMILMNTWGDRSRDGRNNEAFALRELEAASRLGVTHLQLDDGWQAGLSVNSASAAGSLWEDWHPDSWKPHPERYPNGLRPIVDKAEALGMQLGLWFNPSAVDSYANWERDARVLVDLYRRYGVRTFKIDGIQVPDKRAEKNLRRLFDRVMAESGNRVVFNLDVTAGIRPGYHHFVEYGNIFLENRYTDWGNYYPYRTLRNLWMLSRYVPPQRLQIEFLNKWRNADQYPAEDPLAPANVPFDYAFAVTMMAQPLAWMEGTGLPDSGFEVAPVIEQYRKLQVDLHRGRIFPIGEQPDGTAWSGFQSVRDRHGYVLVFREFNTRKTATVATWFTEGDRVEFQPLLGHGNRFEATVGAGGTVSFTLPNPHSFGLYRYRLR